MKRTINNCFARKIREIIPDLFPFDEGVAPLLLQFVEIILLIGVERFLKLASGDWTADCHADHGLANDWKHSRVLNWLDKGLDSTLLTLS